MASRTVTVIMSSDSVEQLLSHGFYLHGFKAVRSPQAGGAPLLWLASNRFTTTVDVGWDPQYQAYSSHSYIIPNGLITPAVTIDIRLDQTFHVTDSSGNGKVVSGGSLSAISINNDTSQQLTCGLSQLQRVTDTITTSCVFPLHGDFHVAISPADRVLLLMTTMPMNVGTVVERSYAAGILVDLTTQPALTVGYDINRGWSTNGSPLAQLFPPNTEFAPLLITK